MPEIPVALRLITATVSIGADSYSAHIQDFKYTPSPVLSSVTDVTGLVTEFVGESAWKLDLNVFQDFSVTGLARKMLDDEGEKVTLSIVDGPDTWTSEVKLVAPQIGGATKQVGVSPLSLPSTRPAWTATAGG